MVTQEPYDANVDTGLVRIEVFSYYDMEWMWTVVGAL